MSKDICEFPTRCFLMLHISVLTKPSLDFLRPVFLTPFSKVENLNDPKLHVGDMVKIADGIIQFVVEGVRPAAFVWLSTPLKGRFSDNGFVLFEKTRFLNFTSKFVIDINEFSKNLTYTSLFDVYRPS